MADLELTVELRSRLNSLIEHARGLADGDENPISFPIQCNSVVDALAERGYIVSAKVAEHVWQEMSYDVDAGWIGCDSSEDAWGQIYFYISDPNHPERASFKTNN